MKSEIKRTATQDNIVLLVLALLGAALFLALFQRVTPAAKLQLELNRKEAETAARDYLKSLDYNVAGFEENVMLVLDDKQESFLQAQNATPEERRQIDRHHPVAAWEVIYRHPETSERFQLMLSPTGEVFHFEHILPTNVEGEMMPQAAARLLTREFLAQHKGIDWEDYETVDAQMIKQEARTDHNFIWENRAPAAGGLKLRLKAIVLGDKIGGWMQQVQYPREFSEQFTQRFNTTNWFYGAGTVLLMLMAAISLVIFMLRFRAGEVGLRNALLLACFIFICTLFYFINVLPAQGITREGLLSDNRGFYVAATYINILLLTVIVTVGVFLVWISGESLTREAWPEKLRAYDALFTGRFFFPEFGYAILRGTALACIHLGCWYALVRALIRQPGQWLVTSHHDEQIFSAFLPAGLPIFLGVYTAVLFTSYAPLFTLSFLNRRLKNTLVAAALTLLLFETVFSGAITIHERWWQAGIAVLVGVITYIFYWRYDLLTVSFGVGIATALPHAMTLLAQPDGGFRAAGWFVLSLLFAMLIFGYVAIARGKPISDRTITPRYVRYLTERERLKMELEIARKAQLRMLPQQIPQLPGLDIAAHSEPAKEVGGDYYDFVRLDENRLGVVIGDVSGKGMPAALYMTLTKGFLQARALPHASPREILCGMNRGFYQTADRNMFVSLFYLIFNPAQQTVMCARAGHNPIIIHKHASQYTKLLQPPGIALGLEKGEIFERIIQQETCDLEKGDTLVLYTDGLTEAMNHKREEFGEERLLDLIASNNRGSASDLLDLIRKEHRNFIGREDQFDDLTCVVVKIK